MGPMHAHVLTQYFIDRSTGCLYASDRELGQCYFARQFASDYATEVSGPST